MISRRILAFVAIAAGAVVLTGCSDRTDPRAAQDPAQARPFKIGVMTGPVSQDREDFRAGELVEREYPGRVMHITYPDNFSSETETIVAQLSGLAADPEVRVIVVGQAVPGSSAAGRRIRATRSDVLIGFVGPHEDPGVVNAACDIAIRPDPIGGAPVDSVAIRALTRLLVDAADKQADFRDSSTVRKYLESEAGGPVGLRRHDPGGNQWFVVLDNAAD